LEDAVSVGYDMEHIAGETKFELKKQSEKMNRIGENIKGIDGDLTVSNNTMKSIER
jgi:hypothetical protein